MSIIVRCNGCQQELSVNSNKIVIKGERANGLVGGYPLPDHDFDWCERCAMIAFRAVEDVAASTR